MQVFKGTDMQTGALVAIKQMSLAGIPPDNLAGIMGEIDLLRNLNHRNIVKYIGPACSMPLLHMPCLHNPVLLARASNAPACHAVQVSRTACSYTVRCSMSAHSCSVCFANCLILVQAPSRRRATCTSS